MKVSVLGILLIHVFDLFNPTDANHVPAEGHRQLADGALNNLLVNLKTASPSHAPSVKPTSSPSKMPSMSPSRRPTALPSTSPTLYPSTSPSVHPTAPPSIHPTRTPSIPPTQMPSADPVASPSDSPSRRPSTTPTYTPSVPPSLTPSRSPSKTPTSRPSTHAPTEIPEYEVYMSLRLPHIYTVMPDKFLTTGWLFGNTSHPNFWPRLFILYFFKTDDIGA